MLRSKALLALLVAFTIFVCGCGSDPASETSSEGNIAKVRTEGDTSRSFSPKELSPAFTALQGKQAGRLSKSTERYINTLRGFSSKCDDRQKDCLFIKKVVAKVPYYKHYVLEGMKAAYGKQIDMIGYRHPMADSISGDRMAISAVKESMQRVIAINLTLKPDLMGVEGCYDERCDEESELEDAKRLGADLGLPLAPDASLKKLIVIMSKDHWWYKLRETDPNAPIVGIDDYEVHSFESTLDQIATQSGLPEYLSFDIRKPLIHLRSDLAVARMGHLLKNRGLEHGTIAMGYWHVHDFKRIAKEYGLHSAIYYAIPPEEIQEFEENEGSL